MAEQPVVVIFIGNAVASVDFVVSGKIKRDLRLGQNFTVHDGHEDGGAAAVAVVAERERLLAFEQLFRAAPAWGRGAGGSGTGDADQFIECAFDVREALFHCHNIGFRLPVAVIPRMDADFVSGFRRAPDRLFAAFPDHRSGPRGSHQQNVPSVEAGRLGAEHFPEERGLEQTPQVASHVVGADGEEEGAAHPVFVEGAQELRHAVAGAAQCIDVDAESGSHFTPNSPDSTACFRKKSRVISMESSSLTTGFQSQYFHAFLMLGLRCWTS